MQRFVGRVGVVLVSLALLPDAGRLGSAQETYDSPGGYIDSAVIGTRARVRFDAAYGADRPDRAEFFYGKYGGFRLIGDPSAPGPLRLYNDAGNGIASTGSRIVDRNADFQEAYVDLEQAFSERFSAFVELPFRFLNPEFSENSAGLGDIRTGCKYALIAEPDRYLTFQLRNYLPTGEALAGLGTNHYSIEPGLLYYDEVTPRLTLESELRAWIPLEGSKAEGVTLGTSNPGGPFSLDPQESYTSEIIRYGLGVSYDLFRLEDAGLRFTPVLEFVGWEVLGGFKLFPTPGGGKSLTHTADRAKGDSIVNVKFGMRVVSDDGSSLYVGYGRALTDEVWYSDTVRLEYRRSFAPRNPRGSMERGSFDEGPQHLTLSAGGVFLDRSQADSIFAMTDTGPVLAPNLGFQSGIRVGSQWHSHSRDIDIAYLGIFSGLEQGFATGFRGSQIPGTTTILTTPNIVVVDDNGPSTPFFQNSYVSTLNSVEVNIKNRVNSRLRTLCGARWLSLDEDFDYASSFPGFGARTDVSNNLIGLQIGMDAELWDSGRFHLNGLVKSGIYFSNAEHNAKFNFDDVPGFTHLTVHDTRQQAAFLGECELTGSIDLNDALSLRLGYQVMWLGGVALGPEQIAVTDGNTGTGIDSSGSVFWHGGLAQIETTW